MTHEKKAELALRFAEDYDIRAAAKACGLKLGDARAAIAEDDVRCMIDEAVANRLGGAIAATTRRALAEFERIAFSDEDFKPTDRIRAIEQYLKLAPPPENDGVVIYYEYQGTNNDA